ncbi:MAG: phage baseplate assembly protein V [Proteobacteria bacterium]|nr:phage baseplate assembly protein V [Pseudomonadota bacterium]
MTELEQLVLRLASEIDQRRYGKYRGFVADNRDPEQRGRLKLIVPSVLADQVTDWALPCMPFGGLGQQGLFAIPDRNAQVWVEFEEGDIDRAIWTGTFWQSSADIPEGAAREQPTTRVLQTASGHILQFDDEQGNERIHLRHPANADVTIEPDGSITLTDASGNTLRIDATAKQVSLEHENGSRLTMSENGTSVEESSGNRIDMDGSGISVEGHRVVVKGGQVSLGEQGGEPLIKGQSFLAMFMSHTHTGVSGPTSPPLPQDALTSLSAKVTTT